MSNIPILGSIISFYCWFFAERPVKNTKDVVFGLILITIAVFVISVFILFTYEHPILWLVIAYASFMGLKDTFINIYKEWKEHKESK